jgi:flagellar biosynthesis protein FliR
LLLVAQQVLIGLALGFAVRLVFAAWSSPARSSACRWA